MEYPYPSGPWTTVGAADFTSTPMGVTGLSLALDKNGTPYVSYIDGGDSNKVTVQKYNSSTGKWQIVGMAGISRGAAATGTSLAIKDSSIYVTYQDRGAVVKKFNSCAGSGPVTAEPPY